MLRLKVFRDNRTLAKRLDNKNGAQRDQEIREGRLIIQLPQTNNNQRNDIPLKTIRTKNNLINNRLLLKTNKSLIVEPQNKKKLIIY